MDVDKKMVQLYKERDLTGTPDSEYMPVNFKIKINTAVMLNKISAHFQSDRHNFGGGLLDELCLDLFNGLTDEDAANLAQEADIQANKIYGDKGITPSLIAPDIFGEGEVKSDYWSDLIRRKILPSSKE